MPAERRFTTSYRETDTTEPGLVLEDDGTIWQVKPDGTREQIGGSQPGAVRWLGPCKVNAFSGQQVLVGGGSANGGTFTLTLNSQTTALIPWDATTAQVVAALEALPSVGAGNVVRNPRWGLAAGLHELVFKELVATALLTGDGSGLTGPDAPYNFDGISTNDWLVEMFTPAVGDIIEDFFHVIVEGFTDNSSARLYYTDSTDQPTQNGPAWSIPNSAQGVAGLELDFDEMSDFTNFSGLASNPGQNGQPTSLMALLAHWSVSGGAALYTSLPATMRNAVPIYSYFEGVAYTPTQGEIWIWVKVSTPAPLMD